jgi:L-ribulokinase
MSEHGVTIRRVINTGGIPQKNAVLNRVCAILLGRPVLVPSCSVTSLGSAILTFLATGTFSTVEEARTKICPSHKLFQPDPFQSVYDRLYPLYCEPYFAFARPNDSPLGRILPELIPISESMNRGKSVSH